MGSLCVSFDFVTGIAMNRLILIVCLFTTLSAHAADARFDAVDASVEALRIEHDLGGAVLVLAQNGVVVHQRAYGGYALDTRVPIASASKWLSATLVARLVDQGRMRWDDPISNYLPDAPVDKRAITLRQLFSLTSGIPGGDLVGGAGCLSDRDIAFEACARQILDLPLTATPGTVFDYGGNSMQVAGYLAERATGQRWADLFRRELAAPLGLTDTAYSYFPTIDAANPRIAGGVFSTAGDYMKLLLMWRAHGKVGTQRLLNSATITDMDRDHTVGARVVSTPLPGGGYGLGHWIERKDANGHATLVASRGAFGFTPWIDLRRDIAGVLLIFGDNSAVGDDVTALIDQIASVLDKDTHHVPFADFGGIWWRPQESGSGFTLVQRSDHQLTGSFYTFDDSGQPLWLVFSGGQWQSSTRWRGGLYRSRYSGSGALTHGVERTLVRTESFGEIQFDFADADHGQLTLAFPHATRTLPIQRFPF